MIECNKCGTKVNVIPRKQLGIKCDTCYIEFLERFLGEIQKWMELNRQAVDDHCYNDHLDEWTKKNVGD